VRSVSISLCSSVTMASAAPVIARNLFLICHLVGVVGMCATMRAHG
jgi:hypothetical protein